MSLSVPLAALLALAAPGQIRTVESDASSFLGEETALVVHLDLSRWDARAPLRRVLGALADEADVGGAAQAIGGWVEALKAAGAKDLFVLFDPADMPGLPIAMVPLAVREDQQAMTQRAIAQVLEDGVPNTPLRWPASEKIRGVVVAGTPGAVARVRTVRPVTRRDLVDALFAVRDAPVRVAIIPSTVQRRAIEETLPDLPPPLGGGPITTVTRGMRWASLALTFQPRPTLRAVVQAQDAAAAVALRKIIRDGLGLIAREVRDRPAVAELAETIGRLKPEAQGNRILFEADLEQAAALVAVPIRQAREAARRAQCTSNLKDIGNAMHNYHSAHNAFPAAYSASRDGRPLLSWRVHLLPFLDQQALYDEFHLDEPWDSPHNKALISRMPKTYACPGAGRGLAGEGKATYLTPRGPDTIFPGATRIKIQDIPDGTVTTIFVVDVADAAAVIWTKPDDWEPAPAFRAQDLISHHPGGVNITFADNSVRFVEGTITPEILKALTTRNGDEVIRSDAY